jgi:V8-like Glu-specific endopeptidase
MGAKRYDSGWDDKAYWHNIGYAGDLGTMGRPLWQSPFALDEDEWDLGSGRAMQTTGDFMRGQSGSPVFAFWSGLPYVVAVASAGSGADNYCSGGSDLKQLVREARAGDP